MNPSTQQDNTFYDALGIARTASQAEVKSAYRKLALKHHPDKNPNQSDEDKELWLRIQNAYDILRDPKTRSMYDKFGEEGMGMWNSLNSTMALGHMDNLANDALFCCCSMWCFLLLFIFVGLKFDGDMDADWALLAIPLWLVDIVELGWKCSDLGTTESSGDEEDEAPQEPPSVKPIGFLRAVLMVTWHILFVWALTDSEDFVVAFIPLFLWELVGVAHTTFLVCPVLKAAGAPCTVIATELLTNFKLVPLRMAFYALLAIKLNDITSDLSWFVVFTPVFILLAIIILSIGFAAGCLTLSTVLKQQPATFCCVFLLLALAVLSAVLVPLYGEAAIGSMTEALIPVYILLGVFAVAGCLGSVALTQMSMDLEDFQTQGEHESERPDTKVPEMLSRVDESRVDLSVDHIPTPAADKAPVAAGVDEADELD
jgi:hypothetical protein